MKKQYLTYLFAGLIALLTFLVYLPSLQNDFVNWDDNRYVYENPFIRSIDGAFLRWAFFDIYYAHDWIPLTWISHAVDYAVWGRNPLGHHLTNNILHTVNTFLVVLLIMQLLKAARITGSKGPADNHSQRTTLIAAAVAGLLFGLHPIHVESVAWVSERRDVLYAPFFLISLMMYQKYVMTGPAERNPVSRFFSKAYLMSIGFFLLALMSKPMAVSLPAVLLILDWYPFGRIRSLRLAWSALLEKTPFIALAFFSSVITVLAKEASIDLRQHLHLSTRILVAAKSYVLYLWKMIFPHTLNPLYAYPGHVSLLSSEYLFPFLCIILITVSCVVIAGRNKLWLSVWAYYLITLIPVIGIVQVGRQSMADRYTYLPSIGPFLIASLLVAWVITKSNKLPGRNIILKSAGSSVAAVLLISITYVTVKQIKIWENTVTLFSHVIEASPRGNYLAHHIRGVAFREKGQLDKAMNDFNDAIALNPYHQSYFDRAMVFDKMGRLDEAINDYTTSITTKPSADAYYGRGLAFSKQGEVDKAISDFKKVVDINPRDYEVHTMIGVLYGKSNSLREAIESFNNAVEANPDYHFTYGNRGHAYALIGDTEKALADFSKAIELDQNYLRAYVNRGNLYLATGRKKLALEDFRKACALGDKEACSLSQSVHR